MAVCAGSSDKSYGEKYWAAIQTYVADCGGVLDTRKYTEYSRVILAVTAAGYDATNVAGYDLTAPLADVDATTKQGINGAIHALLALDAGAYASNVRQKYVNAVLDGQKDDGGWALSGDVGDVDMTAMALQALAPYRSQTAVSKAIDRGLTRLSAQQKDDGSFSSYGVNNCESCAQVILTLCQLELPLDDARFVKNGKTALDAMNSFRLSNGSYRHTADGEASGKATEQALLAMTSLQRLEDGLAGVFTLTDIYPPYTDIIGHWARTNIEAAAEQGLFRTGGRFRPDDTMIRSELVAALWQAAGAPSATGTGYTDVAKTASYHTAAIWAKSAGVMNGVSETSFGPAKNLTRAELATALWRMAGKPAATEVQKLSEAKNFKDVDTVPSWATESMGWAVKTGLMKGANGELRPNDSLTRAEAATMLMRYLEMME